MGSRLLAATPALLLGLAMAVLYVRLAWWVAQRLGPRSLLAVWLGATILVVAAAALRRGPASADELLIARPASAWVETALLAAIFALPAFGLAALSVRKRLARHPTGPTLADWAAGMGAALCGVLVPAVALTAFVLIFWA
jgi:hypothetical protein